MLKGLQSHQSYNGESVVVDGPFQTENGVQTGVQAMTSCVAINLRVTMIYEPQKKQNIFVLLEITFSNLW